MTKQPECSASTGWMTSFLKRHALHNIKMNGEIASADELAAKEFPQKVRKIIEDGGRPQTKYGMYHRRKWPFLEKKMPSRTYVAKS